MGSHRWTFADTDPKKQVGNPWRYVTPMLLASFVVVIGFGLLSMLR